MTRSSSGRFVEIGSRASVDDFRNAAIKFTKKASASSAAAVKTLTREGIITRKGNLTKHYTQK